MFRRPRRPFPGNHGAPPMEHLLVLALVAVEAVNLVGPNGSQLLALLPAGF